MRACRLIAVLGAANGFAAVAFGAFGAHVLKARLAPEQLATFHTGSDYQGLHALALLATGLACLVLDSRALRIAGALFVAGILLFSGSLYLLAVTGTRWLGAVTPFGGGALLAGWLLLAVGLWRGAARR
jgi:uncharacterized membrane protein YgdD (TMEM256/DUF423 family)